MRARYPDASLTTSDIDADGVAFTADRFGAKGVPSNGDFRQLDLGGPFDLIWVGSLLTHLSQLDARRMLDCLVRHMAPGALLVVTSHGDYVADRLQSWDYGLGAGNARIVLDEYERTGYGYCDYPGGTGYGISLIRRSWLECALAGSPLRMDAYLDRGWDNHQDVVVMRLAPQANAPAGLLGRLAAATSSRKAPSSWFESPPPRHADLRRGALSAGLSGRGGRGAGRPDQLRLRALAGVGQGGGPLAAAGLRRQ